MAARRGSDFNAAKHARNLLDTPLIIQRRDAATRFVALHILGDRPLPVSLCSNLRQMGDTQHLPITTQLLEQTTDDLCNASADTDINFVEDQRRHFTGLTGDDLNSQTDTRQLATGSHLGQ